MAPTTDFQTARTIGVLQGEYKTTQEQDVVFSTVLGSCIAACLYDPHARVGGMNHFLLATSVTNATCSRYGINAMELLINGILKLGGVRNNLRAKIFGGGHMMPNLPDIGASNIRFVQQYLKDEGIECVSSSVGGVKARRVRFHPASGRAQQVFVTNPQELPVLETPQIEVRPKARALEFF